MDAQELGRRIRAGRERRQWTQQQLAEAVGSSVRTVGGWERGETIPQNRLGALEFVLDVDLGTGRTDSVDVPVPELGEDIVVTIPVKGRHLTEQERRLVVESARAAAEAGLRVLREQNNRDGRNGQDHVD
jgi:transcriptional regulator with XRE-family HTH domain